MPYPPSYNEIYPVVTAADANNIDNTQQMGWRQPEQTPQIAENVTSPIVTQPTQPPPYGSTQQQGESILINKIELNYKLNF